MPTQARQVEDQLLVLEAQAGDAGAMDRLARRWHRPFLSLAWGLTGDADAASEVVQEAWLAIVRGLRRLEDPAAFPTWAFRIVHNKSSDWLRARTRSRRRSRGIEQAWSVAASEPGDGDEDVRRLREAMERQAKGAGDGTRIR